MFKQDIWIEKTQTHTTYGLDQFQELCKVIHFVLKKERSTHPPPRCGLMFALAPWMVKLAPTNKGGWTAAWKLESKTRREMCVYVCEREPKRRIEANVLEIKFRLLQLKTKMV